MRFCCIHDTYTPPASSLLSSSRTHSLYSSYAGFHKYLAFTLYTHTPPAPCLRSSSRTQSLSRSYAGFHNTCAFTLYTHDPTAPCLRSSSRTHSLSRSCAGFHFMNTYLCVYAVYTIYTCPNSSLPSLEQYNTVGLAFLQGFTIFMRFMV